MVIHLLDQRRLLHLNDPVSEYIPEFGCQGKDTITIQHVLTHRAGMPNLPPEVMRLETLEDDEEVVRIMCAATPAWRARPPPRVSRHHRRVHSRRDRQARHRQEHPHRPRNRRSCSRSGLRWTNYGVAPRDVSKVALAYFTGPPLLPPLSTLLERALGVPMRSRHRAQQRSALPHRASCRPATSSRPPTSSAASTSCC